MITIIPEGLRICEICGDLAAGEICATCEELADRYDARYHAHRAAQLFAPQKRELPRDLRCEDGLDWDGLGCMRGLASCVKFMAVASLALWGVYLFLQWRWPR